MGNNSFEGFSFDDERKIKICLAASSGGHLEQIMMLKPLALKYDGFLVTEKTAYSTPDPDLNTYYLKQTNRHEKTFVLNTITNAVRSIRILIKEKPNYLISTGVLATLPICFISKLVGIKVIYIESFAKVNSGTLSGRVMYKFADMFIVQWKEMLKVYPNAKYYGGIY
ncbi:PssD/Cps14F family polysaccharide biosynthesis glycosyltransferase [Butyrivibrio sp. MC2013]|uniref:PssD/Cps14F family polysaccharide biosynthesis glycosyltransferase n=1 Tax=Butyrivibrio sp. MC2013 TaxID=1280686 RepID=UPI00041E3DF9|nr:PssD/Cps14F family polysaccharide biosynthesis glycosyltransferase [Butyrivibrio sp. MC2013]